MRLKALAIGTARWVHEDLNVLMIIAQLALVQPTRNAITRHLPRPVGGGCASGRVWNSHFRGADTSGAVPLYVDSLGEVPSHERTD